MKFRPCIDLHNGKVKQIVGKTLSDDGKDLKENFIAEYDSTWYAKLFKSDNLDGGHIIMLGPNNEQAAFDAISVYPGGFQVGGGITPKNGKQYIDAGASHVIFSSYLFKHNRISIDRLKEISMAFDKENVVFDLSCVMNNGKFYVAIDRWQTITDFELSVENVQYLQKYCSELLIHAIDVEGSCSGVDVELLKLLAAINEVCNIKITYAGGIATVEDINLIKMYGKGNIDFTVGSALDIYGGNMNYCDVLKSLI